MKSYSIASRQLTRGVFDFGAGVDVHAWRWIALRGDARDLTADGELAKKMQGFLAPRQLFPCRMTLRPLGHNRCPGEPVVFKVSRVTGKLEVLALLKR